MLFGTYNTLETLQYISLIERTSFYIAGENTNLATMIDLSMKSKQFLAVSKLSETALLYYQDSKLTDNGPLSPTNLEKFEVTFVRTERPFFTQRTDSMPLLMKKYMYLLIYSVSRSWKTLHSSFQQIR